MEMEPFVIGEIAMEVSPEEAALVPVAVALLVIVLVPRGPAIVTVELPPDA